MAKNYGYLAKIGADTSDFSKAMKNLLAETRTNTKNIAAAFGTLKIDAGNTDAAAIAFKGLTAQAAAAQSALAKLNAIKDDVYSSGDSGVIEKYENTLMQLSQTAAKTGQQMDTLRGSFNFSDEFIASLADMDKYGKKLEELRETLQAAHAASDINEQLGADNTPNLEAIDDINREIAAYEQNLRELSATASNIQIIPPAPDAPLKSTKEELAEVQELLKKKPGNKNLMAQNVQLIQKASEEASEKLQSLRTRYNQLQQNSSSGAAAAEMRELERQIAECTEEVNGYNRQLNRTETIMNSLGSSGKKDFTVLTGAFSAFLGNIASSTLERGADLLKDTAARCAEEMYRVSEEFEASMSQVAATMMLDTASGTYGALEEAARAAGRDTVFTATQGGEALNFLALAGYDANEAIAALPVGLKYAQASGQDLGTAVDVLTDSMTALGLKTEDAAESAKNMQTLTNQMSAAASNSNTTVAQMGEAILEVGATARNLKGGTQELGTMIGILADNGIKGAEGGTKLRNAILSLVKPTKDAQAALDTLGVSLYDMDGNMRALPDVFLDMQDSMAGWTQEARDTTVAEIFNTRDLAAINALLATTEGRFDELSEAIGNSEGATERMAATLTDTLQGQRTIAQSALQSLEESVFSHFSGKAKDLFSEVAQMLNEAENSIDNMSGGKLDELADKMHELLAELAETGIKEWLPSLIDKLSEAANHIDEIKAGAKAIGESLLWVGGISLVSKGVTGITNFAASIGTVIGQLQALRAVQTAANTAVSAGGAAASSAAAATAAAGTSAGAAAPAVAGLSASVGTLVSAFSLAVTGAALMGNAIKGVMDYFHEAKMSLLDYTTETQDAYVDSAKRVEKLQSQLNEFDNGDKFKNTEAEIDNYLDKLDELVDENGNVGESEYAVQSILDKLNEAMGTNIQIIDGQVEGYNKLRGSIDSVTESYLRKQQIEAAQEGYSNAVSAKVEAEVERGIAEDNLNDANADLDAFTDSLGTSMDEWSAVGEKIKNGEMEQEEGYAAWLEQMAGIGREYDRTVDSYREYLQSRIQDAENAVNAIDLELQECDRKQEEWEKRLAAYQDEDYIATGKRTTANNAAAFAAQKDAERNQELTKQGVTNEDVIAKLTGGEDSEDVTDDLESVKKEFDDAALALEIRLGDGLITYQQYADLYRDLVETSFGGTELYNEYYKKWQDIRDKAQTDTDKRAAEAETKATEDAKEAHDNYISAWNTKWDSLESDAAAQGYTADGLSERADALITDIVNSGVATEDEILAAKKRQADFWEKEQEEQVKKLRTKMDESDDDDYDLEWLAEQLKFMAENAKTDSLRNAILEELADVNNDIEKAWKETAEKTIDAVDKAYEDVEKAEKDVSAGYLSNVSFITAGKDKSGKTRNLYTDLDTITNKYKKYNEYLEKIQSFDLPRELYNEIISVDDLDAKLQMMKEIIDMPEKGRKLWIADFNEMREAQNTAAETENKYLRDDADKAAAEAVVSIYDTMPETAYEQGTATADAYVQGIIDKMQDVHGEDFDVSSVIGGTYANGTAQSVNMGKGSAAYYSDNAQPAAAAMSAQGINTTAKYSVPQGGSAYSGGAASASRQGGGMLDGAIVFEGDPVLKVNVAGRDVIEDTLRGLIRQSNSTGGNSLGL